MKILFVYPNILRYPIIPVGVASLVGSICNGDDEVNLFDATFIEDSDLVDNFINKVRKYECDILAIHCTSSDWRLVKLLLSALERNTFKKKITKIIGGHHPSSQPDEVIAHPAIDIVVIGEGELVLKELVEGLKNGNDIRSIKNCFVKINGVVFRNDVRPLLQDLDLLPFPNWTIFDERHLIQYTNDTDCSWKKKISLETSRGCPYRCSYCMNSYFRGMYQAVNGKFCRFKSVDRVVAEARLAKENLNIGFVQFVDDNFIGSLARLRDLSDKFSKTIGLPIFLHTSAEKITKESIGLLKKMGLLRLGIGVETGNEEYRKRVLHKQTTNEHIMNAVKLAKENGIIVMAYYMIGLPMQPKKMIEETISFNDKLKPSSCFVSTYFPFPGTSLYTSTKENGLIPQFDYLADFYGESILQFADITSLELDSYKNRFSNIILDRGPFTRRNMKFLERLYSHSELSMTL